MKINTHIWLTIILLAFSFQTFSQTKKTQLGSFETTITFNGEPSTVAYYVPLDYNESQSYKLIVGLHFCIDPALAYKTYRNLLIDLSDSLNAIIMCPDCHNNTSYPYQITDSSIIYKSIDSTIALYNIDMDYIYLTGGSCNGRSVLDYGLENIYDVRGVISFNPYIPSLPNGYHNYDTEMPACTCSGTLDPSYTNASRLHDSLEIHGAYEKFISMEGIGHDFFIPEFNIEMMNCIHWIDSVRVIMNTPQFIYSSVSSSMSIYPNPFREQVKIDINFKESDIKASLVLMDLLGNTKKSLLNNAILSNKSSFNFNIQEKGTFILKLSTENETIYKKIISL